MRLSFLMCFAWFFIIGTPDLTAQQFLEKHNELGVQGFAAGTYGSGISLYDWNKDGFDDIVVLSKDSLPAFYLNNQNGFERVYFSGVNVSNDLKSVVWADINNDGNPDLSFNSFNGGLKLYLNNGDFSFTDITDSSGVFQSATDWGFGISWADINNDGFLDLFVANYNFDVAESGPNHLYKNNGDLTFSDITISAGINSSNEPTFMGVWFDYNNDNKNDLLILNDRTPFPNYLHKNQGNFQFADVSQSSELMDYMDSMTGTVGDFNNDGYLDVYVSNTPFSGNKLYRNYQNGTFIDVAGDFNLRVFNWCWGATWVDYNNDTFQDLFVVTQPFLGNASVGNHYLFRNNNGTFDWQVSAGFAGSAGATFSTARGDFNNDGHPDLVTHSYAPLGIELWMNQIQTGNYLKVALEGVISNRDAVGARVTVYAGGISQTRFTLCGEQFISQNSQWQHFGLGNINNIDSLVVLWPSGQHDIFYNISPNQSLQIIEGSSITNQIAITQGSSFLCPGDSVILDGGNWSHYQWSTGDTTRFLTLFNTDSVYLTVQNSDGFSILADPVLVSQYSIPIYSVNQVNPSCFGANDGQIEIEPNTTNLYNILWENGTSGFINAALSDAKYHFTIFYEQGCTLSDSAYLFAPQLLQLDSIVVTLTDGFNVNCVNSYSLDAYSSGGTQPYSQTWNLFYYGELIPYLIIENQDQICVSPSQNSRVLCHVIDANFCIDSSEINIPGLVNIVHLESRVSLFPNPFESQINIHSASSISDVVLMDVLGRSIELNIERNSETSVMLNTVNLAKGIYIVRINLDTRWFNYRIQKK